MMRRGMVWWAALWAGVLVWSSAGPARGETCFADGVHAMVVPFADPEAAGEAAGEAESGAAGAEGEAVQRVGRHVGALLALQVLVGLRSGPGQSAAVAVWEPRVSSPVTSHASARAIAHGRARPPQLVLWGSVLQYGEWVVIHPRLTVAPENQIVGVDGDLCQRRQDEIWRLALPDGIELSMGLPRREYIFRPFTLPAALAERYAMPATLRLHATRDAQGRLAGDLGEVGDRFVVKRRAPGAIEVKAGERVGWVDISSLQASGDDALAVTVGVMRLMRRDWTGADEALASVSGDGSARALRVDALLLRALAALHRGESPRALLEAAERLDPHSAAVAQALITDHLRAFAASRRLPDERARIRALVDQRRYLLVAHDGSLRAARALVGDQAR